MERVPRYRQTLQFFERKTTFSVQLALSLILELSMEMHSNASISRSSSSEIRRFQLFLTMGLRERWWSQGGRQVDLDVTQVK
jgi:hypothetical protein